MVFDTTMKKSSFIWVTALGLFGLVLLFVFTGALSQLPATPAAVTNNTTNATVAAVAVADLTQFADRANNGTDGGFTLLRVTASQWEFLKDRGLRLHYFGNVADWKYPPGFGPILVHDGFFDGASREWLPETAHPEVFWAAVQTAPSAYAAKEASGMAVLPFMTMQQAIRLGMTNDDEFVAVPADAMTQSVVSANRWLLTNEWNMVVQTIITQQVDTGTMVPATVMTQALPLQILDGYRRKKKDKEIP